MKKSLYITEKPSVAMEFAKVLNVKGTKRNGYIESESEIITWCVGHLVNMSYPEKYDQKYKKWVMNDLPFLPQKYKYEVISGVKSQFEIVKSCMQREDVDTVYVCTDSGREGEYIYRLVDDLIGVKNKTKKRVWIDSQTEDEIRRGVSEAKDLSFYDKLADSAYLRAKEDYLIGINFSRLLTLAYGSSMSNYLGEKYMVIAVGRVMSCVLGMIVQRERDIRNFVKTPYYKVVLNFKAYEDTYFEGEFKAVENSKYYMSNKLFKDIGFKEKEDAVKCIEYLKMENENCIATVSDVQRKKEKKNAPLLYNLAELQNECSKRLKLSPDETLKVVQSLYEKKMLTYPRTDARVLSKSVALEIDKNIKGLLNMKRFCKFEKYDECINTFAENIYQTQMFKGLEKTKYVNDKAITDHYAIVPTGQGIENYNKLSDNEKKVFVFVVRRFLAIFYPPAVFNKLSIITTVKTESFFTNAKVCIDEGYMAVLNAEKENKDSKEDLINGLKNLKRGQKINIDKFNIKESETTPPKRYNSGSIILAMENAGRLIEDENLREQIKGSGIGTSATRAEILNKLEKIDYVKLNKKTQILTPTFKGEMIYNVIVNSVPSLVKPELTASWEKGLEMVASGDISSSEYMKKLEDYIIRNTNKVTSLNNKMYLLNSFADIPNNNFEKRVLKNKENGNSLGMCPKCKSGEVLENKKAFYCTNWKDGCKFTIWKNALENEGIDIDKTLIEKLLSTSEYIADVQINKDNEKQDINVKLIVGNYDKIKIV